MASDNKPTADIEALLQEAKNGNAEAFGTLYDLYFTPVFRYLYLRTKEKQAAEDLAQTVFLKAYQSLGRYREEGKSPLHYFFTIARNTFIDYLRRQKHAVLPITDEVLKNTADSAAESARAAEKRETAQTVKSALLKLTEEQQEIIIMKFINELSNREIAAILGKSEEAVRQLQYRALKALRRQMPIR